MSRWAAAHEKNAIRIDRQRRHVAGLRGPRRRDQLRRSGHRRRLHQPERYQPVFGAELERRLVRRRQHHRRLRQRPHSGKNFAVNGFGSDGASVSSATAFNFSGAWFATPAGGAEKASWINISAYDSLNHLIGSTGNVTIGDAYSWVGAAFTNVSRLSITRDGGWYVMDDLTTSAATATAVPEPGTGLMLGIGLLTLVMVGRRRSSR